MHYAKHGQTVQPKLKQAAAAREQARTHRSCHPSPPARRRGVWLWGLGCGTLLLHLCIISAATATTTGGFGVRLDPCIGNGAYTGGLGRHYCWFEPSIVEQRGNGLLVFLGF